MRRKKLGMGELEAQVMSVLWDGDAWLTASEVHRILARKRRLAYTTVMTVLVRLHEKGLVERERDGRAYRYHPVQSREDQAAARMADVLDAAGNRSLALSRFVDSISATERAQLRRVLGRRR